MGLFDKLMKKADNPYAGLVDDGNDADVQTFVDTGSYTLNAILSGSIYGGLPGNKVTALAGSPSTGKTFFALHIIKRFLNEHKDGGVFYFESESAVTTDMLTDRGIDTSRFYMVPVSTVEEFRSQCVRIIDGYLEEEEDKRKPMLMVLDSLGMLSTIKETTDIATGSDKRDMTKPGLVKGAFRVITLKLGRAKIPMIVTNHIYDQIGAYIPAKVMGGGTGLAYAASTVLFLDKSKKRDKTSKEITGSIISVKNPKARLTVENKDVDTLIDFQTGLNRYYGLLEFAKKADIVTKEGAKFAINGVLTTFGEADAFETGVYKTPEKYFTQDVLDLIENFVQKEFRYGSSNALDSQTVE